MGNHALGTLAGTFQSTNYFRAKCLAHTGIEPGTSHTQGWWLNHWAMEADDSYIINMIVLTSPYIAQYIVVCCAITILSIWAVAILELATRNHPKQTQEEKQTHSTYK